MIHASVMFNCWKIAWCPLLRVTLLFGLLVPLYRAGKKKENLPLHKLTPTFFSALNHHTIWELLAYLNIRSNHFDIYTLSPSSPKQQTCINTSPSCALGQRSWPPCTDRAIFEQSGVILQSEKVDFDWVSLLLLPDFATNAAVHVISF